MVALAEWVEVVPVGDSWKVCVVAGIVDEDARNSTGLSGLPGGPTRFSFHYLEVGADGTISRQPEVQSLSEINPRVMRAAFYAWQLCKHQFKEAKA